MKVLLKSIPELMETYNGYFHECGSFIIERDPIYIERDPIYIEERADTHYSFSNESLHKFGAVVELDTWMISEIVKKDIEEETFTMEAWLIGWDDNEEELVWVRENTWTVDDAVISAIRIPSEDKKITL